MAKFASVFMSMTHRRLICALAWVATFALIVVVCGVYALHKTAEIADEQAQQRAAHFLQLRSDLQTVFDAMESTLTAKPCSPAFREQLLRIAFRPDGFNEFLYAPGGKVECSTRSDSFGQAADLGEPDIDSSSNSGVSLWLDRDLSFLGLPGEKGTFALRDPFVTIIPARSFDPHPNPWMSMELVLVGADKTSFHRGGQAGIYERQLANPTSLWSGRIGNIVCEPQGVRCAAVEASLGAFVSTENGALIFIVAALAATLVTSTVGRLLAKRWTFEARFRRHLDAASIICAYQPVMRLDNGEIAGCEVLARWRDVDGSIVFPDRFLPVVERCGMTMQLTELVAEQAGQELSGILRPGQRLKVSFNICPRDLDAEKLLEVFAGILAQRDRFELILEIIESDEMPADAQSQIDTLRHAGIRIYIDDFGTGYSNMGSLAALSIDGVKLDRSFAMAPDDSIMVQMLHHAIDIIGTAGRVVVVEGVETAERLELLRSLNGRIDYVQGYHIARPLNIAGLASFLDEPTLAGASSDTLP